MSRIPDNAIVVKLSVCMTYSVVRQIDRGIPGREKLYHEYLHTEHPLIGSAQVMEHLPSALQSLGAAVVKKVGAWEYKAAKVEKEKESEAAGA